MTRKARVLLFDIETAPTLGYVWGLWETNVIKVVKDWHVLCFAAKWLDETKIISASLPDFPLYKKEPSNDKCVMEALWKLLDEADIVIAHNGDKFDIKKSNARFIMHGMSPPSPYQTIDTLKLARRHFKFDSNKLDELGRYLGVGRKMRTGGFSLWEDCMNGDLLAWRKMVRYNRTDTILLEHVYNKILPWSSTPNLNVIRGTNDKCPKCGGSLQSRGFNHSKTNRYRRFQCMGCGGWSSARSAEKGSPVMVK